MVKPNTFYFKLNLMLLGNTRTEYWENSRSGWVWCGYYVFSTYNNFDLHLKLYMYSESLDILLY
jgi:hypothetical protein